jgi:Tfp pilus assembly protein FimT
MIHHPPRSAARSDRAGISLLAILISLCAVAIAAMVAIPAFFGQGHVTLDNAAHLLRKDLRSAQNRAAFLKTEAVFHFDEFGWRAALPSGEALAGPRDSNEIVRDLAGDGVFEGVWVSRVEFGDDGVLTFDARGVALEGGEVELAFGDERRTVRIERGTGFSMILDGSGNVLLDDRVGVDDGR